MKKYILDKGFIKDYAHVSYECPEEFETLEEAKKEAELKKLGPNEFITIWSIDESEDVLYTFVMELVGDNNE